MLRPLRAADVEAVLALQAQCYEAQFLESAQAFVAKLEAAEVSAEQEHPSLPH